MRQTGKSLSTHVSSWNQCSFATLCLGYLTDDPLKLHKNSSWGIGEGKFDMDMPLLIAVLLLCASTRTFADTPAKVLIPFGEASLWAAGLKEVRDCRNLKCDEETTFGMPQVIKYALNNARIVVKHLDEKDSEAGGMYADEIDRLLIQLEKVEGMEQGYFVFL